MYERVEIPGTSSVKVTERKKQSTQDDSDAGRTPERPAAKVDAESPTAVKQTAYKPLTTRASRSQHRSDIQLASYQDPTSPPKAAAPKSESVPVESPTKSKQPTLKIPDTTAPDAKGLTVPNPDTPAGKTDGTVPAVPGDQSTTSGMPDLPAGTQLVTLDQAVAETESSFLLQAEAERMYQAQADYTTASLLPNPTLSTIASLQPFPGRPFTITKTGGPPQYDLGINYPFDWLLFGKRKAAMMAAGTWTQVAENEYQDVLRQRLAITRSAFFDVLEARDLRDLSKQDVQNLKQVEGMTIKKVDLGGAGTVELDRIRLALLNAERDLQTRETTLKNSKSTLRMLMGRTEMDPDFEVAGSLDITQPSAPVSSEEVLMTAQESRPDIQSLRRQVEWAMNAIYLEERKAKPQFGGFFGLTYQLQKKAIGAPNAPSYGGGVVFSVPLFDRNQGNITKAQSVYSQANYNLHARLSSLQSEVDQAVTSYRAAYQAVTSINVEQGQAARNVRDKVAAAFDAGGQPLIEVLDTERQFRDTSRLLINGRANYWKSLYQLNSVAGTTVIQ